MKLWPFLAPVVHVFVTAQSGVWTWNYVGIKFDVTFIKTVSSVGLISFCISKSTGSLNIRLVIVHLQ